MTDVFEKLLKGRKVNIRSEEFAPAIENIYWANAMCHRINLSEPDFKILKTLFDELFNGKLPPSSILIPPIHIYFPRHLFVAENVFVNHNSTFMAAGGIEIGEGTFIGPNVSIITDNHEFGSLQYLHPKRVKIGNRVWIGANALILPGVTIGDDAVVGGGAVVTSDVESKTLVGGNPAKVIKKLK